MLVTALFLLACNGGEPDDTASQDNADDTGGNDTADTSDTSGDTSDTSVVDTADTSDTDDTADTSDTTDTDPPVPACDLRTPYKDCTAVGVMAYGSGQRYGFTAAWDADGFPTEEAYYDEARTTLYYTRRYTWTAGNLVSAEKVNRAGTVLESDTYTYDATGNVATHRFSQQGGYPDLTYRYSYDANGYVVQREMIVGSSVMDVCRVVWASTDAGATYEESCGDSYFTGEVDARRLETTRSMYQRNGATQFWALTRTFRDDCQPLEQLRDGMTGGNIDGALVYAYDADGRRVEVTVEGDPGEGTPNRGYAYVATLTYTCPS